MANTVLAPASLRHLNMQGMQGTSAAVPLDAQVTETFQLPAGWGNSLLDAIHINVQSLSGAYVAPTPSNDGLQAYIRNADAASIGDMLMAERFIVIGTSSTRPIFAVHRQFFRSILFRQTEFIVVNLPIIAGAGVTGDVVLFVRGMRIGSS